MAFAVVEVEAGLQQGIVDGELVAAGGDEEVGVAVAVCVEEEGGAVVLPGIFCDSGLGTGDEGAVGGLQEELGGVAFCAADEAIVETVAVDIGFCHGGAAAGEIVQQKRLLVEVVIVVLPEIGRA